LVIATELALDLSEKLLRNWNGLRKFSCTPERVQAVSFL